MITPAYVRTMAAYNRWQNQNLYGAADRLSDAAAQGAARRLLRLHPRHAQPPAVRRPDLDEPVRRHAAAEGGRHPRLGRPCTSAGRTSKRERAAFDEVIIGWAEKLDPQWLEGDLTWYSGAAKREVTRPKALLVAHFFNHQTHHRGQVHCMLTQCGAKPGDTDLSLLAQRMGSDPLPNRSRFDHGVRKGSDLLSPCSSLSASTRSANASALAAASSAVAP